MAFEAAAAVQPEFLGTIIMRKLRGDGSRTTTCEEISRFDIRVYDEFNNQQQSGIDQIEIASVAGNFLETAIAGSSPQFFRRGFWVHTPEPS